MRWILYTVRFGSSRPRHAPQVGDPERVTEIVARGLDWMDPQIDIQSDRADVRLTMSAPSAEAALAHLRGSYRSALHAAGVGHVGLWPLHLLSVETGAALDSVTNHPTVAQAG